MLVSTKGRYALRLMIYIAHGGTGKPIALREISEAEDISLKYLEQLAHTLVTADLLSSIRGHGGGYTLKRDASTIKVGDILRAVEGTTAPVACLGLEAQCPRESICTTVQFWAGLDRVIENYVDGVMLSELAV
jgi:Rrf2 family protein